MGGLMEEGSGHQSTGRPSAWSRRPSGRVKEGEREAADQRTACSCNGHSRLGAGRRRYGSSGRSPSATESKGALTKKKVKNIATNVANSRIAALAPTLSVKSATTANSANTATTANRLSMFAQVTDTGALTGSNLGFGSVSHPSTGIYCFTGLARQPVGGEATVDYDDSAIDFAQFGLGQDISLFCPASTQAFVGTFTSAGATTNDGFFVELW